MTKKPPGKAGASKGRWQGKRAKRAFEIKERMAFISLFKAFDRARREKENPGPVPGRLGKTKQRCAL